jgi:hypothetical protein
MLFCPESVSHDGIGGTGQWGFQSPLGLKNLPFFVFCFLLKSNLVFFTLKFPAVNAVGM